jgi:hypothetical protein
MIIRNVNEAAHAGEVSPSQPRGRNMQIPKLEHQAKMEQNQTVANQIQNKGL